jgi:hypothetical protein
VGHSDVRCISVEQWVELKSSAGRPKDVEHLSMYFSEKKKRERS